MVVCTDVLIKLMTFSPPFVSRPHVLRTRGKFASPLLENTHGPYKDMQTGPNPSLLMWVSLRAHLIVIIRFYTRRLWSAQWKPSILSTKSSESSGSWKSVPVVITVTIYFTRVGTQLVEPVKPWDCRVRFTTRSRVFAINDNWVCHGYFTYAYLRLK